MNMLLARPLLALLTRSSLWALLGCALIGSPAYAQDSALEQCLQTQVLLPANDSSTVAQLRSHCINMLQTPAQETDESIALYPIADSHVLTFQYSEALRNSFFRPYKNNYISFGSMKNEDGSLPFSGSSLDIKFELGMKFGLFPVIDEFKALTPLKIGYSQRSWWDISEDSAPFKEHNYNPEIFWDFGEALAQPADHPRLHIFDLVGFEHQSNGLDGVRSRSWDRVYASRTLDFSEMWSWTFKYWKAMHLGEYNKDIEKYLGSAEIITEVNLNNWARINLKTLLGRESDKLSYQVDLIIPMSRWVNSRFFLSYYNGYGEALVSYNQKTSSVRAGFFFPLGF